MGIHTGETIEHYGEGRGYLTQTHALLTGSPVIDAVNPGGCTDKLGATLTIDQSGFRWPVNGGLGM